jgi:uncharacterized membrane protein (DUF485 family)
VGTADLTAGLAIGERPVEPVHQHAGVHMGVAMPKRSLAGLMLLALVGVYAICRWFFGLALAVFDYRVSGWLVVGLGVLLFAWVIMTVFTVFAAGDEDAPAERFSSERW